MHKTRTVVIGILLAATSVQATDLARAERVGDKQPVRVETPHPVPRGALDELVWSETFHWPEASYLAVHFERFEPAPGERVVVHSPDFRHAHAFKGEGKPGSGGTFWATHIPGDTLVVSYHGNGAAPGFGLIIDELAHGFPLPPGGSEPDGSRAICGTDDSDWAQCYLSSEPEIYRRGRAVARLLINGVSGCTGWLIGCDGHLMTNNHCIQTPVDALNTDYEFLAEGSCATDCASFGACPGVVEASLATFVKTDPSLDYTLVRLPDNLTPEYGYLRLRDSGPVLEERIYIPGHPGAWGKRFSVESSDASDESGFCEVFSLDEPACQPLGPDEVGYACDTQGGSSGSPVLAYDDHRVVALHHCGSCENRGVAIQDIIAHLGADLPACSLEQLDGVVSLDRETYACEDTATILVSDDSIAGAGTQIVEVSSTTEAVAESVVLTETPAGSGSFLGSVAVTADAPAADGRVSVAPGDTITVRYIDADDGAGGVDVPRTDSAGVDCTAPAISNVTVESITGSTATIGWDTDEPADSLVRFGELLPPGSTAADPARVTRHAVELTGLAPCTTYLFAVESADEAGNSDADDNGGAFHTFTTLSDPTLIASSTDTPVTIPDNTPAGARSLIRLTDNVTVVDVDVEIDVTHTFTGDLIVSLIAPDGEKIRLADMRGDGADYRDTVFDDEGDLLIAEGSNPFSGRFRPERPLAAADGILAAGDWTLEVVDLGPIDFGTIDSWTLELTYLGQCGPSLAFEGHQTQESCPGAGGAAGDAVADPGEDVVLPVVLRNDGTEPVSAIAATLSSSTPGVTISRAGATFPDIAPETTASSSAPHFALSLDTSLACGGLVELHLDTATAQGTFGADFGLRVGTGGLMSTTYVSSDVPKVLVDTTTTTSTVAVGDASAVQDVDLTLDITHTWVEDLDMFLIGPGGMRVELSTDNGGSGDDYSQTTFDDEAPVSIVDGSAPFSGRFRPEGSLADLDGASAAGSWTLEITDDTLQDPGLLNAWSVTILTGEEFVCQSCDASAPATAPTQQRWLSPVAIAWDAVAGASFYRVYRGAPEDLPALADAGTDSCLRETTADTTTGGTISEVPAPGSFWWYLVRAGNGGGEGPVGPSSTGPRSQEAAGSCP